MSAMRRYAVVTCVSDIRVCARDGEPLVFTFEYPGAEYVCLVCGGLEDIFGARADTTPERRARLSELRERYERERAERTGRDYTAPPKAGDPGVLVPKCKLCGATPDDDEPLPGGKPAGWFSRDRDGVTEYACSSACIPAREMVFPW